MTTPITHVIENFRQSTNRLSAAGDTALWDALALAKDQLKQYAIKYPNAKKRVIIISDGADTKSTSNTSRDLCWQFRNENIAVDSVSLGDEENGELRTLSYLLGCYRFHPTSLANALAICELEPFLSLSERPDLSPPTGTPTQRYRFTNYFYSARWSARATIVTADTFPPRKEHPNIRDGLVELTAATRLSRNTSAAGNARSNLRTTRLITEMQLGAGSLHPTYDVYVSESDFSFWKVVISGPENSPYSAGSFLMYLHADEGYPTFAPKARFVTRILHPNVNSHGRICHSLFDRDWTTDTSMTTVLDTVYGLLYQSEMSDSVNTGSSLGFHHDQVEFADETRKFVKKHASMTRKQW